MRIGVEGQSPAGSRGPALTVILNIRVLHKFRRIIIDAIPLVRRGRGLAERGAVTALA